MQGAPFSSGGSPSLRAWRPELVHLTQTTVYSLHLIPSPPCPLKHFPSTFLSHLTQCSPLLPSPSLPPSPSSVGPRPPSLDVAPASGPRCLQLQRGRGGLVGRGLSPPPFCLRADSPGREESQLCSLQNNMIETMQSDVFCDAEEHRHTRRQLEDVRLDGNPINLSLFPSAYFCLPRLPTGRFV